VLARPTELLPMVCPEQVISSNISEAQMERMIFLEAI